LTRFAFFGGIQIGVFGLDECGSTHFANAYLYIERQ
jgi:hypothetical protein